MPRIGLVLAGLVMVAGITGAAGAIVTRHLLPGAPAGATGTGATTHETLEATSLQARVARLERESDRPRLAGSDVLSRLIDLDERLRALEGMSAPPEGAARTNAPDTVPELVSSRHGTGPKSIDDLVRAARQISVSPTNGDARLAAWRKVIGANPPNAVLIQAHTGSAWALRALRRYEEEEEAYGEIVRIAGEESQQGLEARFRIAFAQRAQDKRSEGLSTLRALAMDSNVRQPLLSHAWFNVGKLAQEMGDTVAARHAFQHVVDESRSATLPICQHLAEQARRQLDELETSAAER